MPQSLEPDLEIVYPRGGRGLLGVGAAPEGLAGAMRPASFLYSRVSTILRRYRVRRRAPLDTSAVVVSVGNLEIGGNGKTPFAVYLLNELSRRRHRPLYVSRGFRSVAERLGPVTVFAPCSAEPARFVSSGVRFVRPGQGSLSESIGDEGAMVADRCPGVPLAFSQHRARAVQAASRLFDPTHVILDDAFQTWSVARHIDIVLLDAEHPLGNGRVIPAGTLRENPDALVRAHLLGFNGVEDLGSLGGLSEWAARTVGRRIPVFGVRRRLSFSPVTPGGAVEPPEGRVAALSSIGRPRRFETLLASYGVDLVLSIRFPDHYRYVPEDIRRIGKWIDDRKIDHVVTTEKDWVKLRELDVRNEEGLSSRGLLVARLDLDILGDDPVGECEKPQALPAASA